MTIPTLEELTLLSEHVCQALADPKRMQLLYILAEQPRHVNELSEILGMAQSTVSRHLSILRYRGLVVTQRDGTRMIYWLHNPKIITVLNSMQAILRDTIEEQTDTMRI
ncbi:MAG TPA: metalloregulator ArsR/SmtB family transcription factor [Phototrophicaceae bacterium]|nr:metalloregulator ArsR/SmtB family transcription factor [Phototrophicaceae bacterium]